ncbi:hypothetical protein GW891_02705 [bacterium]|nr:hypothetical protein [bacterium]
MKAHFGQELHQIVCFNLLVSSILKLLLQLEKTSKNLLQFFEKYSQILISYHHLRSEKYSISSDR